MRIVLVTRRTEEWGQLNLEKYVKGFIPYLIKREGCFEQLQKNLVAWGDKPLNYFQYRHRLKQLAMSHWELEHISLDEALEINDPNVILVPIDDDDIVHPELESMLEYLYTTEIQSVSWNTWAYSLFKWGNHPPLVDEGERSKAVAIPSNCYSIRSTVATKDLLLRHDLYSCDTSLTRLHWAHKKAIRLCHPASIYSMQMMDTVKARQYNHLVELPQDIEWGREFLEQVMALHNEAFGYEQ